MSNQELIGLSGLFLSVYIVIGGSIALAVCTECGCHSKKDFWHILAVIPFWPYIGIRNIIKMYKKLPDNDPYDLT